jgi:hypothetical protein
MTDKTAFICDIDESAGLRADHHPTLFAEVMEDTPPSTILVYCGDNLVRATKTDDGYQCRCGQHLDLVW